MTNHPLHDHAVRLLKGWITAIKQQNKAIKRKNKIINRLRVENLNYQNTTHWFDPKKKLPKYGQLIAVKWDDKSPKDFDCWRYCKEDKANWKHAVSWTSLLEPT